MEQVQLNMADIQYDQVHHFVDDSIPLPRDEPLADAFKIPIGTSAGNLHVPRAPQPLPVRGFVVPQQPPLMPQDVYHSHGTPLPGSAGPLLPTFDPRFPPTTRGVAQLPEKK